MIKTNKIIVLLLFLLVLPILFNTSIVFGMSTSDKFVEILGSDKQKIRATMSMPEGKGPFPAIIMAYGTPGFDPGFIPIARWFSSAGFISIVIDYDSSIRGVASGNAMKQIHQAIDVLNSQPEVAPGKLFLWGFSNGGAAALHLGENSQKVKGVIAVVPYLPNATGTEKRIQAPVLLIGGEYDTTSPIAMLQKYEKSLRSQNKAVSTLYGPWGHVFEPSAMTKAAIEFMRQHMN